MSEQVSPLAGARSVGRHFSYIPVTRLASGADLRLGMHVVSGRADGPTVGITTTIHGDETFALMAVRELLAGLEASSLRGRVAAIPVANPLAVSAFNRQTPEQHGKTDLHEVFPGSRGGNLTQKLAAAITANLLDRVDAFIDIHCGGNGGRLQARADFDASLPQPLYDRSLAMCRAFGTTFVHANTLTGTASRYCNDRNIPTANPEIGGVYLGPAAEPDYMAQSVQGLRGILAGLGMIEEESRPPPRQLLFTVKSRFEVNPTVGGYLRSLFDKPSDLGKRIEKGDRIGEIVDLHTLEVVEELRATVTGYLFFSRYSGVVDAGTKAFALAEEATSAWLT